MNNQVTIKKARQEARDAQQVPFFPKDTLNIIIGLSLEDSDWLKVLSVLAWTSKDFRAMALAHLSSLVALCKAYKAEEAERDAMRRSSTIHGYDSQAFKQLMKDNIKLDLSAFQLIRELGRRVTFVTLEEKDGKFTAMIPNLQLYSYHGQVVHVCEPVSKESHISLLYVRYCQGAISWKNHLVQMDVNRFFDIVTEGVWPASGTSSKQDIRNLCVHLAAVLFEVRHTRLPTFGAVLQALKDWMASRGMPEPLLETIANSVCNGLIKRIVVRFERYIKSEEQILAEFMQRSTLYDSKELSDKCRRLLGKMIACLLQQVSAFEGSQPL